MPTPITFVANFDVDVSKAVETDDGKWLVIGAANSEDEDFDEELLDSAGVTAGLKDYFMKLGGWVDWEHKYSKSKELKDVIGHCVGIKEIGGRSFIITELHKEKPLAQDAWNHLKEGRRLGYSIEGIETSRKGKKITGIKIIRVTLSINPKGYDNTVKICTGSLCKLSKAITEYESDEEDEVTETPCGCSTEKALTAGEGVVVPGDTGGAALREQSFLGEEKPKKTKKKKPKDSPDKKDSITASDTPGDVEKSEEMERLKVKLKAAGFNPTEKLQKLVVKAIGRI